MWHKHRSNMVDDADFISQADSGRSSEKSGIREILRQGWALWKQGRIVRKEEALGLLDRIVKSLTMRLTFQRGCTDRMVKEANLIIFTFGSYQLGALAKNLIKKGILAEALKERAD